MQKISARSFSLTSILFYLSNAYILGSNANNERNDWMCFLISSLIAFVPVFLLSILAEKNPGRDLFTIMKNTFGNVLSRILSFIYALYAILLLSMSFSCFSRYISTCVLLETPKYVMAVLLSVCVFLFLLKQGESIGRTATIFFPVVIIVVLMILGASVMSMKISMLMPIGRENIISGVYRSLAFPFFEPIVLFSMMPAVENGTKKRHWIIPYLVSVVILALNIVRNTTVLGSALAGLLTFPTSHTDSVVGYEILGQRFEVLSTMIPASTGVIEAAITAFFSSQAVCAAFSLKKKVLVHIFVIAVGLGLCLTLYTTGQALEIRTQIWPAISFPLQLVVPLIALLAAFLSSPKKGKNFLHSLKKAMK